MPNTRQKKLRRSEHSLVGTWASADEFDSHVEYVISSRSNGFAVRAIDSFDGEEADIFEVNWDGEALTFATHWNSTGRFARCRFLVQSNDHVDFTYTYTDQALLHRKSV
jgi:hypothetical protein